MIYLKTLQKKLMHGQPAIGLAFQGEGCEVCRLSGGKSNPLPGTAEPEKGEARPAVSGGKVFLLSIQPTIIGKHSCRNRRIQSFGLRVYVAFRFS